MFKDIFHEYKYYFVSVLDTCFPSPCLNGGKCHQYGKEKFTCECPAQFKGQLCQCKYRHGLQNFWFPLPVININGAFHPYVLKRQLGCLQAILSPANIP